MDKTELGQWYLISEFIDGVTLETYVRGDRKGSLLRVQCVDIVHQLLLALETIHPNEGRIKELKNGEMTQAEFEELQRLQDEGFVHRDVKPLNIIVRPDLSIKLLDFNIASRVGDPVVTTAGTDPYKPPDPDFTQWDVSWDLFASGVVLYELLLGEHPYPASQPTRASGPTDPVLLRSDFDPSLGAFLMKACAASRHERFKSARQMREVLADTC